MLKIRHLPPCVGTCSQIIGEHDGVGVLGASIYDARRGEEWIKTHITLKRCSDITTYQVAVEFARKSLASTMEKVTRSKYI